MRNKQQWADQEIYIGPLPKGAGRQEVYINSPAGRSVPPRVARHLSHHLFLVLDAAPEANPPVEGRDGF